MLSNMADPTTKVNELTTMIKDMANTAVSHCDLQQRKPTCVKEWNIRPKYHNNCTFHNERVRWKVGKIDEWGKWHWIFYVEIIIIYILKMNFKSYDDFFQLR